MPKSREEIKHDPVTKEVWRDNHTGVMWFDPRQIQPLGNHILVELDDIPPESSLIEAPQIAFKDPRTRTGTILAVGPGKWHEKPGLSWVITHRWFVPTTLKPGTRVIVGHFSDWESWNCGQDGFEGRDANIGLFQEGDVRLYDSERVS